MRQAMRWQSNRCGTRSHSLLILTWLLSAIGCSRRADDCTLNLTCGTAADDAGTGGKSGDSGTPECVTNKDCTDPSASLCSQNACKPCASNNDCADITGKHICDSGKCVQCTGTQYADCSAGTTAFVCNSSSRTCSQSSPHSAGLCQPCISDAQCALGQLCAKETYLTASNTGYFCFEIQGGTAQDSPQDCTTFKPYIKALAGVTSIDGTTSTLCTLRASTCEAMNEFSIKDCSSASGPQDAVCGLAPPSDAKCAAYGTTQYRCTVICLNDDDCKTGSSCNPSVNPNVCTM